MKKSIAFLQLILMIWICNSQSFAQNLNYTQISSGLQTPEFEGGRTDFCMDDINMDGHVDILTIGDHGSPYINTDQHGICIWFGNGQGSFENFMTGNFGYGGIIVGDVNNDGFKDVGYGMHHDYSSTDLGDQILEVALGDGSGMNWTAWDDGLATNGEDWGMFGTDFGDVDNDGDLDLVSISFGSGSGLHVYLNQGDGTWVQSFGFLDGNSNMLVEFGDFNRDGYLDFIASHQYGTAYFGDGTGNFENVDNGLPVLGSFAARVGISVGDVNNDGADDIAFINSTYGVEVYAWDENFTGSWIEFSGELPNSGAYDFTDLADMNSDGFMDVIAIAGENIKIWLGDGEFNWTPDAEFSLGENAGPQAFRNGGDLDHNGYPDLVLLAETGNWPSYQNQLYCFKESSPADSLWIMPLYPTGNARFYPGTVQFIEWVSEVPNGANSAVTIEISAFGPDGPWWLLAENIPNNGRHQWVIPETGSDDCFLRFTVATGINSATVVTAQAFTIFGNPTSVEQNQFSADVWVYPNPGKNTFGIHNHHFVQQIILSDLFGNPVFQKISPAAHLNLAVIPPGIYVYNLLLKNGSQTTGKWIKTIVE
jgi:hypothetical protein